MSEGEVFGVNLRTTAYADGSFFGEFLGNCNHDAYVDHGMNAFLNDLLTELGSGNDEDKEE